MQARSEFVQWTTGRLPIPGGHSDSSEQSGFNRSLLSYAISISRNRVEYRTNGTAFERNAREMDTVSRQLWPRDADRHPARRAHRSNEPAFRCRSMPGLCLCSRTGHGACVNKTNQAASVRPWKFVKFNWTQLIVARRVVDSRKKG